jgi:ATP-binding cassette subfamily B (MDR/TAP) protein 1
MSRFIDVFELTGPAMQKKGNFFALMFFVMGLGALVAYFVLGWCSSVVAQVRLLVTPPPEYRAN